MINNKLFVLCIVCISTSSFAQNADNTEVILSALRYLKIKRVIYTMNDRNEFIYVNDTTGHQTKYSYLNDTIVQIPIEKRTIDNNSIIFEFSKTEKNILHFKSESGSLLKGDLDVEFFGGKSRFDLIGYSRCYDCGDRPPIIKKRSFYKRISDFFAKIF